MTRHATHPRRPAGFTLVELLIVMVIIGIILAFILQAATGGIRAAETRATQSLITKLENAMTDRLDAVTSQRPVANPFHAALAAITLNAAADINGIPNGNAAVPIAGNQRAQVIAQFDYISSQIPDVFAVTTTPDLTNPSGLYPLNFGRPTINGVTSTYMPIGAYNGSPYRTQLPGTTYTGSDSVGPIFQILPTGVAGAAFEAAGTIYQGFGYGPQGYDGTDNDGKGGIDDLAEGLIGLTADQQQAIVTKMAAHKHVTARSEMLYALLVNGAGPFGSAFQPEDFTAKEVQDTDGDGLLEFVDAWGQPLQFFRWPVFYHSDVQEGFWMGSSGNGPYDSVFQTREQNTLDPNQQLVAPAWFLNHAVTGGVNWGVAQGPGGYGNMSRSASLFESLFVPLREPLSTYGGMTVDTVHWWNRSTATYSERRAFRSKFLILSGGPDKLPGVGLLDTDYAAQSEGTTGADASGTLVASTSPAAMVIEGWAAQCGLQFLVNPPHTLVNPLTTNTGVWIQQAGADDITNHNVMAAGGVIQ